MDYSRDSEHTETPTSSQCAQIRQFSAITCPERALKRNARWFFQLQKWSSWHCFDIRYDELYLTHRLVFQQCFVQIIEHSSKTKRWDILCSSNSGVVCSDFLWVGSLKEALKRLNRAECFIPQLKLALDVNIPSGIDAAMAFVKDWYVSDSQRTQWRCKRMLCSAAKLLTVLFDRAIEHGIFVQIRQISYYCETRTLYVVDIVSK